jgi:hypothetical protein
LNCAYCDDSGVCLTCIGNRIKEPDCVCMEGYLEI